MTIKQTLDCHITGLPYTAAPPTNSGSHPWAGSANKWDGSYVRLHKNTISQTFYAPKDMNVSVYHQARLYTRATDTTYSLSISGQSLYNKNQYSAGGKTTNIDETYTTTIKSSNPIIEAKNTYGTVDALIEYTNVKVYNITVKYR